MITDSDGLSLLIRWLKKQKYGVKDIIFAAKKHIKGSRRDPLFYLQCTALILFSGITLGLWLAGNYKDALSSYGDSQINKERHEGSLYLALGAKGAVLPTNLIAMEGSYLKSASPTALVDLRALGSYVATNEDAAGPRGGVVEYAVQSGDTTSGVAGKFSISLNTLLWANNISSNSTLKLGQKLVILPTDGILHHVKDGDTISSVAKTYQAKSDDILAFNDLPSSGEIYVGDILIVPGGKPPVSKPKYSSSPQVPLASSYFICPLGSACRLSQGLHWYNAVDVQGSCGSPVFAAAAGQVLKSAITSSTSRWSFGGAGNHVTIRHPNGVVSYYGHVGTSLVSPGQQVSQGQLIATVGGRPGTPGAGLSTGCHLHFGVTGARNPFSR